MNARFTPNSVFGILIAIALMVAGFVLGFIHRQSTHALEQAAEARTATTQAAPVTAAPSAEAPEPATPEPDVLSEVAQIHAVIGTRTTPGVKSEFDLVRESLDFSDAPLPVPELVPGEDYDVFVNVTKEFIVYYFDKLGYNAEMIDAGEATAIPPVLLVSIRQGWADDISVQFKKSLFYRVLLSLVLFENEAIMRDREALLKMLGPRQSDGGYPGARMRRIKELAVRYGVMEPLDETPLTDAQLEELLLRVDMVPPSLALAQAAHESGYASSRFAHEGNALFGQWDWGADAIAPEQRRSGMGNYGIRAFDQPVDSVRSYMMNLNTHRAYAGFRAERAAQRGDRRGRIVMDALSLADTLTSYSERGVEYTEELKSTIRFNRLMRADGLRLMEGEPVYFHNPESPD